MTISPKGRRWTLRMGFGYKGSTCYAIGLALVRIVGAVLRDERSVLAVSTLLEGEMGLLDVCLGMPCVVGADGVERIAAGKLNAGETEALSRSAQVLRDTLACLEASSD